MPDLVKSSDVVALAKEIRELRRTVRNNKITSWTAIAGLLVAVAVGGGAWWNDRDQQGLLDDISDGALCPFFGLIVQSVQANPAGAATLTEQERRVRLVAIPQMESIYYDTLDCAGR